MRASTIWKQPASQGFLRVTRQIILALSMVLPVSQSVLSSELRVSLPNGYANLTANDLRIRSTAGEVRWMRVWDGQEWKFNPQWESLSQSWRNLTGSQTADTTAGTVSASAGPGLAAASGGSSGCWVWVDEDWAPTLSTIVIGGVPESAPLIPIRSTPFNRLMGEAAADYAPAQRVSVDYANLCPGSLSMSSSGSQRDAEGIRRINELYLGDAGRYAFNNRSVLEKRAVRQLPGAAAASQYASLATGHITLAPISNAKGYRWIDKAGDWIDYNTQGQVVAWGDKNDNIVWLVRDSGGIVRGAADANGHVLFSLHYSGELITEVRDYPAGNGDLAARSIKYQYDAKNRLTQVTDARGYSTQYAYDAGNHIVKVTDPEGRVEQLAYNGDVVKQRIAADGGVTDYTFDYDDVNKQFISKIVGPETTAGRRSEDYTHNRVGKLVRSIINGRTDNEVRYDTGAHIEISTNARGFTSRTARNEFDQVVEVQFPDGSSQKRAYSAVHLGLTEATDELGVKTQYQYDSKGNLLKKIEAAGLPEERTTEYEVNALGQTTKVTRKGRTEANGTVTPDAIWQLEYDALGQISKTTDPEGFVRQYAYDRAGHLAVYTDPKGNTTRYQVDAEGHLSQITDALGRVRSYQYDKVGNRVKSTDARGKAVQMAYDAMNRRTQTTNPVGGVYKLQYNAQGLPISETDEDGQTQRSEFDNFLRLTKEIDGLGNTTEYGYTIPDGTNAGALGSLYSPTEVKYPTFTQQSRFDERERATSRALINPAADGTTSTTSTFTRNYDKRGRVLSETDAYGKVRLSTYDALGQLIERTDSLGGKTRALYDTRGNLIQLTDAKGNATRFSYDRNNRLVKETLKLGQVIEYQYDEAGNHKQRLDPLGHKTTYRFDAANRLVEMKQYRADATLSRTTTYTWDTADNLTAWSDTDHARNQTSSASSTFDDANRKTGETLTYPAGNTLSYSYAYSAAGKKIQLVWPDGTEIGYAYSAHGQLETITLPGEGSISVNQYKWLEPAKTTLPGGVTRERALDGLLQTTDSKVKTSGQQTTLSLKNTWGKLFELQSVQRTDTASGLSSTRSSTYNYDSEIRLTQSTVDTGGLFGTDTETFTLDAVANRTAHSKVSGTWSYDDNYSLTQRGNLTSYQYDNNGNLTQKTEGGKTTRFVYDLLNRLNEVREGQNALIARYGYDPMSRRLWKEQYRDQNGNLLTQAKRTYYLYADEGLIAEAEQDITLNSDNTVTASGTPVITRQYGPRPNSQFTSGVLFVKTKKSNGETGFAYYHHDHLGTPIQATDKAGSVVWAATYEPFGKATVITPAATVEHPTIESNLRLPGQYFDAETGLHYNWHRYYDPETGRYIVRDPIGVLGGVNVYNYGLGSPISSIDPDGLRALTPNELAFLKKYFGDCLPYDQVDVSNSHPPFQEGRAWAPSEHNIGLPDNYFVNGDPVNEIDFSNEYNVSVFAHEATHGWQRDQGRLVTLSSMWGNAIYGNKYYDYPSSNDPQQMLDTFNSVNVEAQAQMLQDCVRNDISGGGAAACQKIFDEIKNSCHKNQCQQDGS